MRILILALVAFFIAANIAVEWLRRKTDNTLTEPLSDYLTGQYGWLQSASYVGLAVGLALLTRLIGSPVITPVLCAGAVALALVVATKWLIHEDPLVNKARMERYHVIAAGLAFIALTIVELRVSWHSQLSALPIAAVCAAAAFSAFKLTQTAILEKLYTALLIAWVVVVLV